jgi:hypothetical protein
MPVAGRGLLRRRAGAASVIRLAGTGLLAPICRCGFYWRCFTGVLYGRCFTGVALLALLYWCCFTGVALLVLLYWCCFTGVALLVLLCWCCFAGVALLVLLLLVLLLLVSLLSVSIVGAGYWSVRLAWVVCFGEMHVKDRFYYVRRPYGGLPQRSERRLSRCQKYRSA